MNENELLYRKTIRSIGFAMLIFAALLYLLDLYTSEVLPLFLMLLPASRTELTVAYSLGYGFAYLAAFMIPVAFLRLFLRASKCNAPSMRADLRFSPYLPLILMAFIAVSLAATHINDAFLLPFDYEEFYASLSSSDGTSPTAVELVLDLIVSAIVPGVCEEFLFRGGIQSCLRPFGRTVSVLISAFLFAIMHQNAGQIFFAFVGGILFGLVYDMTGNLLNTMVLHAAFNTVSLVQMILFYGADDNVGGNLAAYLVEIGLYVVGTVSAGILIFRFFGKRGDFRDGIFGKTVAPADGYAQRPIESRRAVRLFLHPAMIGFLAVCVLEISIKLVWAVIYQYVSF